MATGLSKLLTAVPVALISGLIGGASTYAQVATDGTVGPRLRLAGPEFEIGADLGTRAGRNLFHSFERFSLGAGERATFSGPDQIRNVISRVTGGARSDIDGTLRSTIPGADFYFLNPAGVVFGPNASLDLQGSFHVSTADELRFADGAKFSASTPTASSLTVASPEAFGFLGSSPNPILVDRSTLNVQSERTLSLVGAGIDISGGALTAAAGEVNLLALGGRGTAGVTGNVGATGDRADIALRNQSRIDTSGDGGGTIRIRGGAIVVEGGSTAFADNTGPSDSQGGIDIDARRLALRDGSLLTADVVGDGTGRGGEVSVRAAKVAITDGSRLAADTFAEGDAGSVEVTAGKLRLRGGFAGSTSQGAGDAGTVTVAADQVVLLEGGQLLSSPLGESTGAGGEVQVTARDSLRIVGRDAAGTPSGIFATAEGNVDSDKDAGNVTVKAGDLVIRDGGVIAASTFTAGNAGAVEVTADVLTIRDGVGVSSGTFAEGDAGTVKVTAGALRVRGGFVRSTSQGAGDAGSVTVSAGRLSLLEGGQIISSPLQGSTGAGGEVRVTASDTLLIAGRSAGGFPSGIFASAEGDVDSDENAGGVTVNAGSLTIADGAVVTSSTLTRGDAGTVNVTANRVGLINGGAITSDTQGTGDGGNVVIHAREALHSDAGFIGASSRKGATDESGNAGTVTIHAGRIEFVNDGRIFNGTDTTGDGGDITVHADTIVADVGSDPTGFHTGISASANRGSSGPGGDVTVSANRITLINGAEISSGTDSVGDAGTVMVMVDRLLLLDGGRIATETTGDGAGGALNIETKNLVMTDGGVISASTGFMDEQDRPVGTGPGGSIEIAADLIHVNNSFIGANTFGSAETAEAGSLTVTADVIEFVNEGRIFNGTNGAGDGGEVSVTARTILADATVDHVNQFHTGIASTAEAGSTGASGSVTVRADDIRLVQGGLIATSSQGDGNAGTVIVVARESLVIRGRSVDRPSSISVSSENAFTRADVGNVVVRARDIEMADGGRIEAINVGLGRSGGVTIRANRLRLAHGAEITAASMQVNAGDVVLMVGDLLDLEKSGVTTSAVDGRGGGGNILIDPEFVVLDDSRIVAEAAEGRGGFIRIVADNLVRSPDSEISAASGDPALSGTVVISSPEVDLSGGLVVLEGALLDAASQLRERCGARRDIGASSFTGVGRGGLPAHPDAPLSGSYLGAAPSRTDGAGVEGPATMAASSRRPALPAAPCLGAP